MLSAMEECVGNIPAHVECYGGMCKKYSCTVTATRIVHYRINANNIFLYQRFSVHYVVQNKANIPTDISTTVECSKYSATSLCHWLLIRNICMIIIYYISHPVTVHLYTV